jgi:hypothetical protein
MGMDGALAAEKQTIRQVMKEMLQKTGARSL